MWKSWGNRGVAEALMADHTLMGGSEMFEILGIEVTWIMDGCANSVL